MEENKTGRKNYQALLDKDLDHPVEKVGKELRSQMKWLKEKEEKACSSTKTKQKVETK